MSQLNLFAPTADDAAIWLPNRDAALHRLAAFASTAGTAYARTRNFDFGPQQRRNVSCLSPWIRHRVIDEREVLKRALKQHSQNASEKFIQEVFWRGYFKGNLEQHPNVWRNFCHDLASLNSDLNGSNTDLQNRFASAIEGRTGILCFDAWAQELISTNYLHNHARMWFASIWIFTLRLPWQLGAGFFLTHLLDGDPASNTLSWRWVAGLHTKGKTYLARADNISRFTDGRYFPSGQLALQAPPLEEVCLPQRVSLPDEPDMPTGQRFGLLITEEDCLTETLPLAGAPSAIAVLPARRKTGPVELSQSVVSFRQHLLRDSVQRAQHHFKLQAAVLDDEDAANDLVRWALENQLDAIVTARPAVGETATFLQQAAYGFGAAGIGIHKLQRAYDRLVWPHTNAGFFKLRKKIPAVLKALSI